MIHHDSRTETTIMRLRVGPTATDPLAARARLERVLAGARWRASGLSPSAILIVRRLRDPMPGSLDLDRDRPSGTGAWERALGASIDSLARRAARPARGPVPADAEAVLLADRSELLACLAADWCDGSAISKWWWRGLLRNAAPAAAVAREWLASIEYAPAAIATLAGRGLAIGFASRLASDVARQLATEIARRFGLAEIAALIDFIATERRPVVAGIHPEVSAERASEPLTDHSAARSGAPRKARSSERDVRRVRVLLAPEAFATTLTPEARLLLAVALVVARAPAEARERRMAETLVSAFVDVFSATQGPPEVSVPDARAEVEPLSRPIPDPSATTTAAAAHTHEDLLVEPSPEDEPVAHAQLTSENPVRPEPTAPPPAEIALPRVERRDRQPTDPSARETDPRSDSRGDPSDRPARSTLDAVATIEIEVDTEFGGVFYLVNAALALGLYGDFTTPLDPGIELPVWDFLALIGRDLVGPEFEADPVWALLAQLSGRSVDTRPGDRFETDPDWQMPPRWLDAFPDRDALSWHGGVARDPMARWTRVVARYLRARLALALGLAATDEPPCDLFARTARVEVAPARLDVRFRLDELTVAVRLAGLDRDPGWVPAAGRAIAFHYD